MSWIESQLQVLMDRCRTMWRMLLDLQQQLRAVQQGLIAAQQQGSIPPSGSSGGFYVCYPTSAVSGASWSGGVPTAGSVFSAVVCQVSYDGTSQSITNLGTRNCVNWLPASLQANYACVCSPDGAGSYGVESQSCT